MDDSVLHGIFWNHLVYPEFTSQEVEDPGVLLAWVQERLPAEQWPTYVVCLLVDGLERMEPTARRDAVQHMRQVLASLPAAQVRLFGFAHGNAVYFCGTFTGTHDALIAQMTAVNARIGHTLAAPATMGIAFLPAATLDGLRWAAQYAIVAQRQKVRTGTNRVYVHSADQPNTSLPMARYLALAQELHAVVKTGDVPATQMVLARVTHTLFQQAYLSLLHLRPILQCQVIFMAQAAVDVGVDADIMAARSEACLTQLGCTFDYTALRDLLVEAATGIALLVHQHYRHLGHRLIGVAEEYIAAHLGDPDLGLQHLATQLGASSSHLSRLFTRIHGLGLTRYIQRQRVAEARRLLLDCRMSITELAFHLGFGSLQHFGRVFKAHTGLTPTRYRDAKIG
jgi:AraC-like DNA-binding protein